MHTEIERKFIVTDSTFKQSAVRIMDIRQGYVGTSSNGEARVSILVILFHVRIVCLNGKLMSFMVRINYC